MEKDNENMVSSTETDEKETSTKVEDTTTEKTYTRSELNKILNAERLKAKEEVKKEYENQVNEAKMTANMDDLQKANYEIEQLKKSLEESNSENNSLKVSNHAKDYANKKGLPLGYLGENRDYSKETEESIEKTIDDLVKTRSSDLSNYLKENLKQSPPKAVEENATVSDPYVQGFENYRNKMKK